jgi:hypothetical protein
VTAGLIALAVLCLALLWLLRDQQKRHQEAIDQREAAWTEERRELLTRIQRPELVPAPRGSVKQSPPPKDAHEFASVGTVVPLRDEDPVA